MTWVWLVWAICGGCEFGLLTFWFIYYDVTLFVYDDSLFCLLGCGLVGYVCMQLIVNSRVLYFVFFCVCVTIIVFGC